MIDAMAAKGDALIKDALADDLAEFSSFERVEPNSSNVIFSAFKQFHHGGEYCKGRGREFTVHVETKHASELFV
eukprot:6713957-Prymnesium_polylepis.1